MADIKSLTEQSRTIEERLKAIPDAILEALRPALMRSGNEVATNMRALVPVESGDLKETIAVTGPGETTPAYAAQGGRRTANANQVLVTVGGTDVRYGHMIEFGTSKAEAHPFMLPGFRIAKPRIERRLNSAITSAIKKEAKA